MKSKFDIVLSNPRFIISRINRELNKLNIIFHRHFVSKSGIDVMEADWDNLLVLDACRYDTFTSTNTLPGETDCRRSLGSTSEEWYEENVGGRDLFDTVCVSANPHTTRFADSFHAVDLLKSAEFWDTDLCTVPPDVVAKRARIAAETYPNKRLFVHFMQPHFPAIGPSREDLPVSGNPPDGVTTNRSHLGIQSYLRGRVDGVTERKAVRAYEENLEIVLDVVSELIDDLDGKTVISSDHGELFGERLYPIPVRGILHPRQGSLRVGPLVEVPWHVVPFSSRREIRSEEPQAEPESLGQGQVESRLEALGYR